ncbi:putative metal-dependent HD superfamily phosphohydrolase [Mucilaginibacter rubeus]
MKKEGENILLKKIQRHVLDLLKKAEHPGRRYYNADHTRQVCTYTESIAGYYRLNESDYTAVMAASSFHDLGFVNDAKDPELSSALQAERFLTGLDADISLIESVKACILATKQPQSPVDLVQQIACDAQLYYLGTDHFFRDIKALRKEWILVNERPITKAQWRNDTLRFMERHQYHTTYGQSKLDLIKVQNLCDLSQKIKRDRPAGLLTADRQPAILKDQLNEKRQKAGKSNDKPDKGIETMFRISSGNHQRLSDMADNKAHIMITVNSIILSAIISLVLRRLDTYGFLVIPTFLLLLVSLAAMTFSILSTRPSVPSGTFDRSDLEKKKVNLLFFGNFYKMELDQFAAGMEMMMEDGTFLYASLIRDIYAQGVILGKKYHLLRISYNIFMYGAIIAVTAFMLAYIWNAGTATGGPAATTHTGTN